MELDHEFTVPVPTDRAWSVLLDVERIAPCMPGATLDSVDGDDLTGRLKVKVGAMTITYKGNATIVTRDEKARTVTLEASGKEARGPGTASATVRAHLHDEGEHTRVEVHTELTVTGRPAQFGRNILSEVGGKLIGRFSGNLAKELSRTEEPEAPAEKTATSVPPRDTTPPGGTTATRPDPSANGSSGTPGSAGAAPSGGVTATSVPVDDAPGTTAPTEPRPEEDAIDLLEVAGPSIAKRAAPAIGAVVAFLLFWRLLRRRKK